MNEEILKEVREKKRIKKKMGEKCSYCGCENKLVLTIDHRIPLCRGGADDEGNKQVVCFYCNQIKGALKDTEFKNYLKALYTLHDLCKVRLNLSRPSLSFKQEHHPDFAKKVEDKND